MCCEPDLVTSLCLFRFIKRINQLLGAAAADSPKLSPGLDTVTAGLKVAWLELRSRSARRSLGNISVLLSSSTWMKLVLALTITEADISTIAVYLSLSVSRLKPSYQFLVTD